MGLCCLQGGNHEVHRNRSFAHDLLAPALAAEDYWIVQNPSTKKCTIVSQKSSATSDAVVVGGDGKIYTTRTEAESAMKTVKVCTDQ